MCIVAWHCFVSIQVILENENKLQWISFLPFWVFKFPSFWISRIAELHNYSEFFPFPNSLIMLSFLILSILKLSNLENHPYRVKPCFILCCYDNLLFYFENLTIGNENSQYVLPSSFIAFDSLGLLFISIFLKSKHSRVSNKLIKISTYL